MNGVETRGHIGDDALSRSLPNGKVDLHELLLIFRVAVKWFHLRKFVVIGFLVFSEDYRIIEYA